MTIKDMNYGKYFEYIFKLRLYEENSIISKYV